jgi:mediator of RNA polymerase II transcription subunit 14
MDPAPSPPLVHDSPIINGINHDPEPTPDDLERELPVVYDGQIPLGDLLSRVVQGVYAELSELAET